MTDIISHLTVALKRDIRDDDIEPLIMAIRMFTDVLSVESHISSPELWTAQMRAKHEIRTKLFNALDEGT